MLITAQLHLAWCLRLRQLIPSIQIRLQLGREKHTLFKCIGSYSYACRLNIFGIRQERDDIYIIDQLILDAFRYSSHICYVMQCLFILVLAELVPFLNINEQLLILTFISDDTLSWVERSQRTKIDIIELTEQVITKIYTFA